jgi:hypothetical protein
MFHRRVIISIAFLSACLFAAFAAPGASAVTGFTCKPAMAGDHNGQNCEKKVTAGTGSMAHVPFTGSTLAVYKNDPPEKLTVAKLHGFSSVEVSCASGGGTGTVENKEVGTEKKFVGTGKIAFTECTTNQAGCTTAKVAEAAIKFESVEGLAEEGVGLKFQPSSGTNLTTVNFEGTCGLHSFGAIPVAGSTIATASGEPKGIGAETVFSGGTMSSLTVGAEPAVLAGKVTIKGPDGDLLVTTN